MKSFFLGDGRDHKGGKGHRSQNAGSGSRSWLRGFPDLSHVFGDQLLVTVLVTLSALPSAHSGRRKGPEIPRHVADLMRLHG